MRQSCPLPDREGPGLDLLECLLAIGGLGDYEAQRVERFLENPAQVGVVVSEQYVAAV